jgi:hypothetical protein
MSNTFHLAKMSAYTSRAIERMKTGQHGDTITPEEMAEIIGRRCRSNEPGYPNVASAIKHVESNHGIVWRWNKGEQVWRCLNDSEKVACTGGYLKEARRKIRRGGRVSRTVDEAKLSAEELVEHRLKVATIGTVLLFTDQRTAKKLAAGAKQGAMIEPTIDQLARLFEQKQ